jgi:transposase
MLLRYRASHIQHMQKALQQMNLKLTNVLSDVTGTTEMQIVRDIIAGERDPYRLAQHRDRQCGKSQEEIAKSLEGDYRFEHPLPPATRPRAIRPKNDPPTDLRPKLYEIAGVDLTQIEGLNILSIQAILSEIGTDMSKWQSVKHFTSWLGLSPQNQKTGGKIIGSRTRKTDNRANLAFRQAAATLGWSQSALGVFYRRMKTKLGTPKAVVATAHKLARIVYHMLQYQTPFAAVPPEQADARDREQALRNLQRKALKLVAKVIVEPNPAHPDRGLVS